MWIRKMKWIAPVIALSAVIALAKTSFADEAGKPKPSGTIHGKVVDAQGEPVAGARVRLRLPREGGGNRGDGPQQHKDAKPQAAADEQKPDQGDRGPREGQRRTPALKEATTDNDGAFSMTEVPVGEYVLFAMQRGAGGARETVKVEEGKTLDITLTLQPRPEGGNRPRPPQ